MLHRHLHRQRQRGDRPDADEPRRDLPYRQTDGDGNEQQDQPRAPGRAHDDKPAAWSLSQVLAGHDDCQV